MARPIGYAIVLFTCASAPLGCSSSSSGGGAPSNGAADGGSNQGGGAGSSGASTAGAAGDGVGGANYGGGGSGAGTAGTGTAGSGTAGSGTAGAGGSSTRAVAVCQRWTNDRMDMTEGMWTGSVATCDAGDVTPPSRANALKLLNLYRFLSNMPEVTEDPDMDTKAQACALIQSANALSHMVDPSAVCYTQVGADASNKSSISSGTVVRSIDAYMTDGGPNADTMGHRRWVQANSLGPVGFGSAKGSCFYQVGGSGKAGTMFAAWPPEGDVPLAALTTTKVDTSGWTVQSDKITLNASAVISVSDAGQDKPITSSVLPGGYGSTYALRFVPNGWTTQAGHSYTITISGASAPVSYTVNVVDCATVN